MRNRNDRETETRYRDGYVDGQTAGGGSAALGIVLGIILVVLLGLGAWFFLGQRSDQSGDTQSGDTNIINVPSPQAPVNPPSAPDVNVTPNVNITVPSPKTNGSSDSAPSAPDNSSQGQ
jgi:cytoskeletal protein RodZ